MGERVVLVTEPFLCPECQRAIQESLGDAAASVPGGAFVITMKVMRPGGFMGDAAPHLVKGLCHDVQVVGFEEDEVLAFKLRSSV